MLGKLRPSDSRRDDSEIFVSVITRDGDFNFAFMIYG